MAGRVGDVIQVDPEKGQNYFLNGIAVPSFTPLDELPPASPPPSVSQDRRARVNDFLRKCNDAGSPRRLIRKDIWRAAGHTKGRQFQYWQNSDLKATKSDDQNFRRILEMNPDEFVALVKRMDAV